MAATHSMRAVHRTLCFKGWLETRSRIAFALIWSVGFLAIFAVGATRVTQPAESAELVVSLLGVLALVFVFVAVWLAGSGIRTQSAFGATATRGLHGSTHFTLSLPVTRTRLLLVRAGLGLVETAGVIVLLSGAALVIFPALRASVTPLGALQHTLTVLVVSFGIYAVAVLAATLVDDVWVLPVSTVAIVLVWVFQFVGAIPSSINLFSPMAQASPLVTHAVPWTALAVSLALGAVCLSAALTIVRTQEY